MSREGGQAAHVQRESAPPVIEQDFSCSHERSFSLLVAGTVYAGCTISRAVPFGKSSP